MEAEMANVTSAGTMTTNGCKFTIPNFYRKCLLHDQNELYPCNGIFGSTGLFVLPQKDFMRVVESIISTV